MGGQAKKKTTRVLHFETDFCSILYSSYLSLRGGLQVLAIKLTVSLEPNTLLHQGNHHVVCPKSQTVVVVVSQFGNLSLTSYLQLKVEKIYFERDVLSGHWVWQHCFTWAQTLCVDFTSLICAVLVAGILVGQCNKGLSVSFKLEIAGTGEVCWCLR